MQVSPCTKVACVGPGCNPAHTLAPNAADKPTRVFVFVNVLTLINGTPAVGFYDWKLFRKGWGCPEKEERKLITAISKRAVKLWPEADLINVNMDVTAIRLNGCPLDLQKLLDADNFNFEHDMNGIANCIDRKTSELKNCFLPRCSKPEGGLMMVDINLHNENVRIARVATYLKKRWWNKHKDGAFINPTCVDKIGWDGIHSIEFPDVRNVLAIHKAIQKRKIQDKPCNGVTGACDEH